MAENRLELQVQSFQFREGLLHAVELFRREGSNIPAGNSISIAYRENAPQLRQ